MKWSKYNYIFKSIKHGYLLFNSNTNSFLSLDKEIHDRIKKIKDNPELINLMPEELKELLIKMKVVIKSVDYDELNIFKFKSLLNKSNITNKALTIALTTDCNFKCSYCYEANNSNNKRDYITKEVENGILNFITNDYKHIKGHYGITWFGGEPLLAFDAIERISEKLLLNNIPFSAGMFTNGYLFNDEIILKLEKYKISTIQISIDGNKVNQNNKCKGKDGYNKVIENIKKLLIQYPSVHLYLRINVNVLDNENYNTLKNELKSLFPSINIHPGIIKNVKINDSCKTVSDCMNKNDQIKFFLKQYEDYNDLDLQHSFYPNLVGINDCTATGLYNWVISPNGDLHKCLNDVGDKIRVIGNILNNSIQNTTLLNRYTVGIDPTEDKKCVNCFCLPICGGGCPFERIANKYEDQKINTCLMQKNKTALEKFLEIKYEMNIKSNQLIEITY